MPDAPDTFRERAVIEAASSPAVKEVKTRSDPGAPPEQSGSDRQTEANRRQRTDKTEAAEPLATFSAPAVKQATDGMTRFEVDKSAFEERSGMKLDKEKVYAFEGDIVGVGSFRKIFDGSSETDRLAFFAPREESDSIPSGERHDIRIDSVREVSRTKESLGTFFATAYTVGGREGREGSVRLDIPKATLEKRTGFHFEDGKTYEARGKIDGEHEFKLTHTGSTENQHMVISLSGEVARKVGVGTEHTVTVDSIEEKRTLTVSGEGPTTRLTPQKRMLESLGIDVDSMKRATDEHRLVELTVRNLSSTDKSEKTVYGRVQPRDGALPLSIGNISGKPGDTFELLRAKEHTAQNFVKDFNKRADGVTKNVRLSLEGEKLYLEVDGKKFLAKSHSLDVHHLQTFLNIEVSPFKQDIRFWYDGERITPKFAQPSRLMEDGSKPKPLTWGISSFRRSNRGLEVTFQMGDRTVTTRAARESVKERMSMEGILERTRVDQGERLEGSHSIRIEDDLVSYINDRITRTKWSNSLYFFERGSLGEDIGTAGMSKIGWDEVVRHPFDPNGPGVDTHKTGTDALYRSRKTGELVLVEFKWWEDSDAALESALEEVGGRQDRETSDSQYGRISGAYVASLNLSLKSNRGELRVKRAW